MSDRRDRDLGMDRPIERRDFLNGLALATGGLLATRSPLEALGLDLGSDPEKAAGYYPPALTGMRGSHEGSYEAAHALRDDLFWQTAGEPRATGESYDLVVVGGGLSGLAAAHEYRKRAGARARILILDNHDDFGGHCRRNEFRVGDRLLIGYGGTYAIDSPAPYSRVARSLVSELGIDVTRSARVLDSKLYPSLGLRPGIFFDKETFGADRLLHDPAPSRGGETFGDPTKGGDPWARFLAEAPMSEAARRDVARLAREKTDYMPGLSSSEKKARLARMSYAAYLIEVAKADRGVLPFFQARPHSLYGVGIDAVSAQDAWGLGFPGFLGLGLDATAGPGMGLDAVPNEEAASYYFHFPDGNATLARLLVRALIPAAQGGRTADDSLLPPLDYAKLDAASAPVRLRLNSTVVRVRHKGEPSKAAEVEVAYSRLGALHGVSARHVVLACWHSSIPWICPDLPAAQREALAFAVKVPIVYTNVVLRQWTAFQKLGVSAIHAPGGFHTSVNLDLPVSLGGYECPRRPEEPIVVHMMRTPCEPGLPARDQHRAGRVQLLATPFATFEKSIREQLGRMLGAGGLDPARDVAAITVNRWPHGYAYQYNSLWDPFWLEGGETPCQRARRPFGRIAIANADAAAYSYTDAAFDEAHRAVLELLKG